MDLGKYGVETHKNVLEFWKKNKIYPKSKIIFQRPNNKNKKPFYFLQGPPYTSGNLHMGTAWNNSHKDTVLRYKRMQGFEVWDRAGYDMHGLPTAKKVQKKYDLKTKEDIKKYGFEKFAKECVSFGTSHAEKMNKELFGLGIWMDYENAYLPINQDFIDGVWFLIKKAHEKNRLYEGLRTTAWCRDCGTALAKHEQEYKEVTDTSIYVKFQSIDDENLYYIIWTTTPWTITFNLAIMVHPDFEYSKLEVDVNGKKEYWVIAKELVDIVMQKTDYKYKIIESFLGKTLEGKRYTHFWKNKIKDLDDIYNQNKKAHSILMSNEYVTLDSGSGLVHTAPGCGPEDYEVGHRNNLPAFNTIDEAGKFPENYDIFSGLTAKVDDSKFIKAMENMNMIIAKEDYVHDYAHCERCFNPVVFRTTKQWFFKVEDLKQKMLDFNKQIKWIPKAGGNAFESWLENLRDNSITKQRYWGTPIPIWRCDKCDHIEVVGSREELESKTDNVPENLHKPWIDGVTWKCRKCPGTMKRLPDILDVWIDAGSAAWNCLYYPKRKDLFEKFYPADFILEAKEQVRGWFNLLMVTNIIAFDALPFKACYMHGMLSDVDGVKMSKSIGNIIRPEELTNKYGADTLRFYMTRTKAGQDINFSWSEAELAYKNLLILWNLHKLLINYSEELNYSPKLVENNNDNNLDISDNYILSRVHSTLKEITNDFNNYYLDVIPAKVEGLFLDVSRTYVQLNRDALAIGEDSSKHKVIDVLYTALYEVIKMLNPLCPFITEQIYQNFKEKGFVKGESINLEFWNNFNEKMINSELEKEFVLAMNIIEAGLSARDKIQIGVRWPLQELVVSADKKDLVTKFEELIKKQLNVKNINFKTPDYDIIVKPDYRNFGNKFGTETGGVLTSIKGKDQDIANAFKLGKDYSVNIKDKPIILSKELFNIEQKSEKYAIVESKLGYIYLDKELNPELELEGFVREITRRVQNLRKNSDMNKSDNIELFLQLPADLNVKQFEEQIKARVGALSISYGAVDTCQHSSNEKIKGKEIAIGFNKK